MRELKFRFWNTKQKKYYADICTFTDDYTEMWNETFKHYRDSKRVVVEQFTGLQDMNGVDVYEGDIVSNGTGRISKVIWHEHAGCFDLEPINTLGSFSGGSTQQWKYRINIIGNIHEKTLKEI